MGAKTAISVEEYLRTSYPGLDREYRDGEVFERTLPDRLHASTRMLLGGFFLVVRVALKLFVYSAMRVRLRTGVFLIPDICVYHPNKPEPLVPDTPHSS